MSQNIHDPLFVAGVFDRCAEGYRKWSAISSFGFVQRWRRQCIEALPSITVSEPVVVDLMAGTGEIWPLILDRYPDTPKITAIDISHQMHLHALEQLHQYRKGRIEHIEADFLNNDLPEGLADCVFCTFGVKTLSPDQQVVFANELARILKPGGVFTLIEASDPKGWILRPLYRFYLDRVLPLVERFFLKGAQDFAMIGIYTRTFGDCSYLETCLQAAGLQTQMQTYFFGCATGITGRKARS